MHDIYRVCFDEDFVGVVLLAMTEKYKTIKRFFKKSSIFGKKRSKLSDQACGRKSFDRHYIFKQVF